MHSDIEEEILQGTENKKKIKLILSTEVWKELKRG